MVNFPLVVSNWALNVSGAFAVSLDGSAKPGETDAGFSVRLVFCALATPTVANAPSAQSRLIIFMAGEFSMRAAKSHARNSSYFIERVMRLPRPRRRERISAKMTTRTATTSSTAPMASAPLRLKPEFSPVGAGALVCVSAIFGGAAFVGLALVGPGGASTGGGFDATLAGAGLVKTERAGIAGSRLVPTFVPIITSGGVVMTGDGGGGTAGGLVSAGAAG